jgi:NADH-quinone oxidoreductase subunit H
VAEVGRAPFDLAEAESEIVAGFNIEYSGLKFGMFYVGEFLHAFTISLLFTALFLGGWQGPWAQQFPILGFVYFSIKTMVVYFFVIMFRGSFPRFRIDQVMQLNWKIFTPIALMAVISTAVIEKLVINSGSVVRVIAHVAANLVILAIAMLVGRNALKGRKIKLDELAEKHRSSQNMVLERTHDA